MVVCVEVWLRYKCCYYQDEDVSGTSGPLQLFTRSSILQHDGDGDVDDNDIMNGSEGMMSGNTPKYMTIFIYVLTSIDQ